ncbi:hypothetical protein Thal_0858 [Thermocrinis albus DSM 14484]|uniref:Uncharacterized protein n=1 Tax=Thermocrinis albus (strain DSM 14484 / JCM 11386 / HI 11/12) TaxID=638303 RepID=D3SL61_THEAH|nr:hypothetical protein [Thermocrinis albus]ADC89491.1 hypothetical protein Thal_0858 [Thermocrinis albus DSM 14484]
MRTAILLFLVFSLFSLTNAQELVLNNCELKIIENQYGLFFQNSCEAYLDGKRVGGLIIQEHMSPPRYGMVGGYLQIGKGNIIHIANISAGKYFAIYEPYRNGLIIITECGASYSNSSNLKEVFKAMLDCLKEKEKQLN